MPATITSATIAAPRSHVFTAGDIIKHRAGLSDPAEHFYDPPPAEPAGP